MIDLNPFNNDDEKKEKPSRGRSSRTRSTRTRTPRSSRVKKKEKKGFSKLLDQVKDAPAGIVTGVIELNKSAAHDAAKALGLVDGEYELDDIVTAIGKDYKHKYSPLLDGDLGEFKKRAWDEDPLGTILDATLVIPGAGVAGKGAQITAKVSANSAKAARAAKMAGMKPAGKGAADFVASKKRRKVINKNTGEVFEADTLRFKTGTGKDLEVEAASNPIIRGRQKAIGKIGERVPNAPLIGTQGRLNRQVRKQADNELYSDRLKEQAPLRRVIRKLKKSDHIALAVRLGDHDIDDLKGSYEDLLEGGTLEAHSKGSKKTTTRERTPAEALDYAEGLRRQEKHVLRDKKRPAVRDLADLIKGPKQSDVRLGEAARIKVQGLDPYEEARAGERANANSDGFKQSRDSLERAESVWEEHLDGYAHGKDLDPDAAGPFRDAADRDAFFEGSGLKRDEAAHVLKIRDEQHDIRTAVNDRDPIFGDDPESDLGKVEEVEVHPRKIRPIEVPEVEARVRGRVSELEDLKAKGARPIVEKAAEAAAHTSAATTKRMQRRQFQRLIEQGFDPDEARDLVRAGGKRRAVLEKAVVAGKLPDIQLTETKINVAFRALKKEQRKREPNDELVTQLEQDIAALKKQRDEMLDELHTGREVVRPHVVDPVNGPLFASVTKTKARGTTKSEKHNKGKAITYALDDADPQHIIKASDDVIAADHSVKRLGTLREVAKELPEGAPVPKGWVEFEPMKWAGNAEHFLDRARSLAKDNTFMKEALDSIEELMEEAAVKRGGAGKLVVPQKFVDALMPSHTETKSFLKAWDNATDAWRTATLTLRPAWIVNNFVGQLALLAVSNPAALADYAAHATKGGRAKLKLMDEYAPELSEKGLIHSQTADVESLRARMSEGKMGKTGLQHLLAVPDAIQKVNSALTDDAPRRALFLRTIKPHVKAIQKQHFMETREKIDFDTAARKLLDNDAYTDRVTEKVLDDLIDFSDLSRTEKDVVRRLVPFYSWIKGSTKRSARIVVDNPLAAQALYQTGSLGVERTQEKLGLSPDFLKSSIVMGKPKGGYQRVITTAGANPFQTPADLLGALAAMNERKQLAGAENPLVNMNPLFKAPVEGLLNKDIFYAKPVDRDGKLSPLQRVGLQALNSFPEYKTGEKIYKAATDGYDYQPIFKPSVSHPILQFLGIPVRDVNLAVARQRGGYELSGAKAGVY